MRAVRYVGSDSMDANTGICGGETMQATAQKSSSTWACAVRVRRYVSWPMRCANLWSRKVALSVGASTWAWLAADRKARVAARICICSIRKTNGGAGANLRDILV